MDNRFKANNFFDFSDSIPVLRPNLIRDVIIEKNKGDELRRSIIRHDPQKLAKAVFSILKND